MIIKTKYGYARSTVPLSPTNANLNTMTAAGDDNDDHHRYLFDPGRTPVDADGYSSDFVLCASLDGLLLLKQGRYAGASSTIHERITYIICNPVTRQWANLPSPLPLCRAAASDDLSFDVTCGFYLHASSGEYRLLVHCVTGPSCWDLEDYCCILSVGSALPRRLPHAPAPPTPYERSIFPYYDYPVCYRGSLHWLYGHFEGSSTGKMLLAFDTVSETFRLMPRPPPPPEGPEPMTTPVSDLLELDGELCVATIYRDGINGTTRLDIWALQDYEAEKWTLRHRLKVQRPPRSYCGGWKNPIIMAMGNGSSSSRSAILVGFGQTGVVMVYSLKDNKVRRKINFGSSVSFKVFSESLVPHAFLDSPDTVPLNFSNPLFNESSRGKSSC